MAISIKSGREIELMREAGKILAITHEELAKALHPGMTTYALNRLGDEIIKSYGCTPSFLHYNGYPASICISVNDEVVHGIPSKKHFIEEGDIVSLDAGVIYKGYHSDAARTHAVGEVSPEAAKLIRVTRECFFEGIKAVREGAHIADISRAVQSYAEANGFSVVRDLVGHGVGSKLHEEPQIPNFVEKKRGPKLWAGMTLAIEPMINAGGWEVKWLDDEWTVVTKDGSLSAHYENTVLVTKDGCEMLSVQ